MKAIAITLFAVLGFQSVFADADVESRTFQDSPNGSGNMAFVEGPVNRSSQANMGVGADPYARIDALNQEVAELRGRLEEQDHQIQQLNKRQRELYLDLEKRFGGMTPQHTDASDVMPNEEGKRTFSNETFAQAAGAAAAGDMKTAANDMQSELNNAVMGGARDEAAYKAAYELMRQKKYTEATAAFHQMLENTPHSKHTANVHFWLGELAMLGGNNADAEAEYNQVVNNYPTSPKAPDSLVKLGMLAADKNHGTVAKEFYQRVINEFPDSPAAQVAAKQKLRLEKAGI